MSKLIREVEVTVSFGDIFANVTIEPQELPQGLRAKLHEVIDSIGDQLNLGVPATPVQLTTADRELIQEINRKTLGGVSVSFRGDDTISINTEATTNTKGS